MTKLLNFIIFCQFAHATYLHEAISKDAIDVAEECLKGNLRGEKIPVGTLSEGRAPLHIAAGTGSLKCCNLLLKFGADVNQEDCLGHTPLHVAAFRGEGQVIKLLVDKNADINAMPKQFSPLHSAMLAPKDKAMHVVATLLVYGANKDLKDYAGNKPVDIAALQGLGDIVELLQDEPFPPVMTRALRSLSLP